MADADEESIVECRSDYSLSWLRTVDRVVPTRLAHLLLHSHRTAHPLSALPLQSRRAVRHAAHRPASAPPTQFSRALYVAERFSCSAQSR